MLARLAAKIRRPIGFIPPALNEFEEQVICGLSPELVAESWAIASAKRYGWNEQLTIVAAQYVAKRCVDRAYSPFAICSELRDLLELTPRP